MSEIYKTFPIATALPSAGSISGFADYNNTLPAIDLVSDVWTAITNNGLGAFTNKASLPSGVTELINTATGEFDVSELGIGDSVFIRNDFTVTPNTNNSLLSLRYKLGNGTGEYFLETIIGRLDSGSGQPYRFSLRTDFIYMGDDNTRLNPIQMQLKLSSNGSVSNAGSVIYVSKY